MALPQPEQQSPLSDGLESGFHEKLGLTPVSWLPGLPFLCPASCATTGSLQRAARHRAQGMNHGHQQLRISREHFLPKMHLL